MKRLIKIIAICALSLSLIGCTKTYQEATISKEMVHRSNSEAEGYFTEVVSWAGGLYMIVYANDTKVKYFIRNSGHGWGITPLYNTDGTLQIYEGE